MVLVEAKVVDSTHLELSKPIAARQGLTVFVSVVESGQKDAERQQWFAAAASRWDREEPFGDFLACGIRG